MKNMESNDINTEPQSIDSLLIAGLYQPLFHHQITNRENEINGSILAE
jgi:hypothetical protein